MSITESERYLERLCHGTFLSLWSHSNVFRDQGKGGKEICDLLVVFGNHVIIFSDKSCDFPDTGDLEKDWQRWYKRAVEKPYEQPFGVDVAFRKLLVG